MAIRWRRPNMNATGTHIFPQLCRQMSMPCTSKPCMRGETRYAQASPANNRRTKKRQAGYCGARFCECGVGQRYEIWLCVDIREQAARRDASAAGKTNLGITVRTGSLAGSGWGRLTPTGSFLLVGGFGIRFGCLERRVSATCGRPPANNICFCRAAPGFQGGLPQAP